MLARRSDSNRGHGPEAQVAGLQARRAAVAAQMQELTDSCGHDVVARVGRYDSVLRGGGLRKRWELPNGQIFEWDSQHGELEKYDKRGKHQGACDPKTGVQKTGPNPRRKVEP